MHFISLTVGLPDEESSTLPSFLAITTTANDYLH